MLNNFELEDIAKHNGLNLIAVIMEEELKGYQPRNSNYVMNLQSSTQAHWVVALRTYVRTYVRSRPQPPFLAPHNIIP
jgi:hypothetical protein